MFQLESRGMKDLIRRLQPDCFEDIVALVALFRPGPLQSGMVDDFIDRKHGRASVGSSTRIRTSQPMLKPTYGVILYQEQVMQIAQVLAGYTLGRGRHAAPRHGQEEARGDGEAAGEFRRAAPVARGVDGGDRRLHLRPDGEVRRLRLQQVALAPPTPWSSYQTAWLKAHYPAAFMAAALSADMDNTDKVVTLIDECRRMGLGSRRPTSIESQYCFTVAGAEGDPLRPGRDQGRG